eukprot:TRINITY_DN9308_c1_g6_i1.p1 TRINITY_DN9308_c1_g6~~TRINITY_DN9308_c1_g6_i1.p1  ORF type:complete len:536 (+),score=53.95 TRINITY_DN9308_c1_g6_i1:154-1761(+)
MRQSTWPKISDAAGSTYEASREKSTSVARSIGYRPLGCVKVEKGMLATVLSFALILCDCCYSSYAWPDGASPAPVCLDDSSSWRKRDDEVAHDRSTPLVLWQESWSSSKRITEIYRILVSEVLGLNVVVKIGGGSPADGMRALAGCGRQHGANVSDLQCVKDSRAAHVLLDVWETASFQKAATDVATAASDSSPECLGYMGYVGHWGLFLSSAVKRNVFERSGVDLERYVDFNASSNGFLGHCFADYDEIPIETLRPCTETCLSHPSDMANYLHQTGDVGGVQRGVLGRCWHDSWWLSPTCRADASRCIPVIIAGQGWSMDALMMQAATYSLPFAIAVARDFSSYMLTIQKFAVLFYGWLPEVMPFQVSEVILPVHDEYEWSLGNKRTREASVAVRKWAANGLGSIAPAAYELASRMRFSMEDVMQLLQEPSQGQSSHAAACEWVQKHQDRWLAWLPASFREQDDTKARSKGGRVDAGLVVLAVALSSLCCCSLAFWRCWLRPKRMRDVPGKIGSIIVGHSRADSECNELRANAA